MDRYQLHRFQQEYFSHSQYSPQAPAPSAYIVGRPASYSLEAERPFLDEILQKQDYAKTTLPDRVFGRQIRHTRLSAKRLAKLLQERCVLHYRHLAEINHRSMRCQEYLFLARLQGQADSRHLSNLERLLVQLESEKRREELALWKDTMELRNALFEKTQEYATAKDRAAVLQPFGGSYDLL